MWTDVEETLSDVAVTVVDDEVDKHIEGTGISSVVPILQHVGR